jgi:hypothetical protein
MILRTVARIAIILVGLFIGSLLIRESLKEPVSMCPSKKQKEEDSEPIVYEGFQSIAAAADQGVPASFSELRLQNRCEVLRKLIANINPEIDGNKTVLAGYQETYTSLGCTSVSAPPFPVAAISQTPKVSADVVSNVQEDLKKEGITA